MNPLMPHVYPRWPSWCQISTQDAPFNAKSLHWRTLKMSHAPIPASSSFRHSIAFPVFCSTLMYALIQQCCILIKMTLKHIFDRELRPSNKRDQTFLALIKIFWCFWYPSWFVRTDRQLFGVTVLPTWERKHASTFLSLIWIPFCIWGRELFGAAVSNPSTFDLQHWA